jgi:hypothetical protein
MMAMNYARQGPLATCLFSTNGYGEHLVVVVVFSQ